MLAGMQTVKSKSQPILFVGQSELEKLLDECQRACREWLKDWTVLSEKSMSFDYILTHEGMPKSKEPLLELLQSTAEIDNSFANCLHYRLDSPFNGQAILLDQCNWKFVYFDQILASQVPNDDVFNELQRTAKRELISLLSPPKAKIINEDRDLQKEASQETFEALIDSLFTTMSTPPHAVECLAIKISIDSIFNIAFLLSPAWLHYLLHRDGRAPHKAKLLSRASAIGKGRVKTELTLDLGSLDLANVNDISVGDVVTSNKLVGQDFKLKLNEIELSDTHLGKTKGKKSIYLLKK